MTKREFTEACMKHCTGVIRMAACHARLVEQEEAFVHELIEQDSDEGSRSGTKRVLGEELYAELQKFKTEM